MMNNKGQTLGISIISTIVALIIGLVIINFITPEVDTARTDLNCAAPDDISDGTKLLCLAVDITVIYWILIIFSVIIGGITGKIVSGASARFAT